MPTCKSCGQCIDWKLTVNKKRMPVEPQEGGNLIVQGKTVLMVAAGTGTHVSHFATCPQASSHRKAS